MVSQVRRDTPAIAAGLNVDDEILAIDDVRVRADGLTARLEQYRPGDKVAVLVARRDRLTRLDVDAGRRAGPRLAARSRSRGDRGAETAPGGLDRSVSPPGTRFCAAGTSLDDTGNQDRTGAVYSSWPR